VQLVDVLALLEVESKGPYPQLICGLFISFQLVTFHHLPPSVMFSISHVLLFVMLSLVWQYVQAWTQKTWLVTHSTSSTITTHHDESLLL
jgi:hypothetical protein